MNNKSCDLCGETTSLDTPGDPSGKIRICSGCGFVHVKKRRSVAEIAQAWTEIYANGGYDPDWPGVKARLFYVAEWLDQNIGLAGRIVLDIGAGNGRFLDYVRERGGYPIGLDPDRSNVEKMKAKDMEAVCEYASRPPGGWSANPPRDCHIVSLNWTLENTGDCLEVLHYAKRQMKPDGHLVISTGSRILVPFKKPLSSYLPQDVNYPHDTHCFRWGWYSLRMALNAIGMHDIKWNDFDDRDEMICVASYGFAPESAIGEDPETIENHFKQWQACFP